MENQRNTISLSFAITSCCSVALYLITKSLLDQTQTDNFSVLSQFMFRNLQMSQQQSREITYISSCSQRFSFNTNNFLHTHEKFIQQDKERKNIKRGRLPHKSYVPSHLYSLLWHDVHKFFSTTYSVVILMDKAIEFMSLCHKSGY
ncbi:CLUMA_CG016828, isoform A [Clunio marinus]|uniref:CLUMA_CG016828, isoform A n=1 Tax=Clunio marinus TaxID=568069 RepID=A0A1J1ITU9_9DIPT|nr:CLUMA_CG016828, isoform A [Clunio marinus]